MTRASTAPRRASDVSRSVSARGCAFTIALGLAALVAFACVVWLACGLSWWSRVFVLGCTLAAAGALSRALLIGRGTVLMLAGGVLAISPWVVRTFTVHNTPEVSLVSLPGGAEARWLSRLCPESDGAVAAATLIRWVGLLRDPEKARFSEILAQAYSRTVPAIENLPTPAINTYLGRQSPESFETIVIRPKQSQPPKGAAIFLHGYAGNFHVYCWEFAQAAAAANLVTICPSTDASGAWWTERGQAAFDATLAYAHSLGVQRVYLAGLSNGAAGAATLAPRYANSLSGVVLISGVARVAPTELPTLIIQGRSDQLMTAGYARAYAAGHANVSYHELKGGHLILLSSHLEVRPLIATFLRGLEARVNAH